jgi:hypothetical protein
MTTNQQTNIAYYIDKILGLFEDVFNCSENGGMISEYWESM